MAAELKKIERKPQPRHDSVPRGGARARKEWGDEVVIIEQGQNEILWSLANIQDRVRVMGFLALAMHKLGRD